MLKSVPHVADEIRSLTTVAVQLATRYECDYCIVLLSTGNYGIRHDRPNSPATHIHVRVDLLAVLYYDLNDNVTDSRPFADFDTDPQPLIIDLTGQ